MNIICVGLSHHRTKVGWREKFAVADADLAEAANQLGLMDGISESVILSTCNRVELYAATEDSRMGFESLARFLSGRAKEHHYDAEMFYHYEMPHSIRHLFRVVSGMESMVLGETQILGQVKKAYAEASKNGQTARHLNKLFQRAFNVAKEVRTKTRITSGAASVGSVAVDLAGKIFGEGLAASKLLILGAGETCEMTLRTFFSRGVRNIAISNRSLKRAASLADKIGGEIIPFELWESSLEECDILISSTAAPYPLLTRGMLAPMIAKRKQRPLFVIDLAVPRDVDPLVNDLEGVYLHDIDSIAAIAAQSMDARRMELSVCEGMIERHVDDFLSWLTLKPSLPRLNPSSLMVM